MSNIVLIGMPGAGKSTIGVILAKALGMPFQDTDLLIQQRENMLLQQIINEKGIDGFKEIERSVILSLDFKNTVIATGGSAVYYEDAMRHLEKDSTFIYIKLSYNTVVNRIKNIHTRGIAIDKGKTLYELYNERIALYEKYAHITVECDDLSIESTLEKIIDNINRK